MRQIVRPVEPTLLVKASEALFKERAKRDPIMTIIANFADNHDDEELLAVTYRLQALKNAVRRKHPLPWVLNGKHRSQKPVNEAMIRAAAKARCPMNYKNVFADVTFDEEKPLKCALAESPSLGEA